MSENSGNGSEFNLTHSAAVAAFMGVSVAFEIAFEMAVFPERLKVDDDSSAARLNALSRKIFGKTKNIPAQGLSETDEADGIAVALSIIQHMTDLLRKEIS